MLETHIHADYASGARALAEITGATLMVSGYDEGETFEAKFPHEDLRDGDTIEIGPVAHPGTAHAGAYAGASCRILLFDTLAFERTYRRS